MGKEPKKGTFTNDLDIMSKEWTDSIMFLFFSIKLVIDSQGDCLII